MVLRRRTPGPFKRAAPGPSQTAAPARFPRPRRPHSEFALSHRLSSHLCPRPLRPPVCGLRGPGQREALAAGPLHPVLSPPVVCEFLFFLLVCVPNETKDSLDSSRHSACHVAHPKKRCWTPVGVRGGLRTPGRMGAELQRRL